MKSGVVAGKAVLRLLQPLNVDAAVAAVASTIKKKQQCARAPFGTSMLIMVILSALLVLPLRPHALAAAASSALPLYCLTASSCALSDFKALSVVTLASS